jgi:hypothetical protein
MVALATGMIAEERPLDAAQVEHTIAAVVAVAGCNCSCRMMQDPMVRYWLQRNGN